MSGWRLFALVWTLAVLGMVFKLVFGHRRPMTSLGFYLAMGWIGVLCSKQVLTTLPTPAILLLLAGGVAYTVGTVFYALDHRRFFHAIWHLFVLAGSGLHYCAVALYVAPLAI
jgi:hemolysin III